MLLTLRSLVRVFAFSALIFFTRPTSAQSPAPATAAPADAAPSACPPMANIAIPSRAAIEAKITSLDSAHLKTGSEIWFKILRPFNYPGCSLDADSVVYAHVTGVNISRNPDSTEISLSFDRADCNHSNGQPLKLRVIALVGPPGESHHMHDDMPTEVAGGTRQIGQAVFATSALDEDLNPGGPPHTIHPGIVIDIPKLKLEPTAGPGCSDKISSTDKRIQFESGSELILAMTVTRNIRKPATAPSTTAPHP